MRADECQPFRPFAMSTRPAALPLTCLTWAAPTQTGPADRSGEEQRRGEERRGEQSGAGGQSGRFLLPGHSQGPRPAATFGSARPELGAGPRIAGELSAEYVRARGAPIRGARIQLRGQAAARAANQATGWPAPRCIRCLTSNPNSWSPNWPSAGPLGRRGANR